jgi:hypothetical protein
MRKLREHSVQVFLPFFAAVCSILVPAALSQQVNASVNSSVPSTSVGNGANVTGSVTANERASISGSISSGGRSGAAGPVHGVSGFGPGSAFSSGVKSFTVPVHLPGATWSGVSAGEHPSKGFMAGAKPVTKKSGSMSGTEVYLQQAPAAGRYAVLGQFPDSTRGTAWLSPPEGYSAYRIGFALSSLIWTPDFDSVEHLKISYRVSLARAKYLKSVGNAGGNGRHSETELERLTNALKNTNQGLAPDLLVNSLSDQSQ